MSEWSLERRLYADSKGSRDDIHDCGHGEAIDCYKLLYKGKKVADGIFKAESLWEAGFFEEKFENVKVVIENDEVFACGDYTLADITGTSAPERKKEKIGTLAELQSYADKDGAEYFPEMEKEIKDLEAQVASGGPLLKRLRGTPGTALSHDLVDRTVSGNEFATIGAPNLLATAGVIYYEIEVVSSRRGVSQIGFAGSSFASCDQRTREGVGDDAMSWGFDGNRKLAWLWADGDVIGFAANIEEGKIAVSKNGAWEPLPLGVFFTNEAIKSGVYPCMTLGGGYTVRYNLDGSVHGPFKHGPPKSWSTSAGYPQ